MKASKLACALQIAAGQDRFARFPAPVAPGLGRLLQQVAVAASGQVKRNPSVARGIHTC